MSRDFAAVLGTFLDDVTIALQKTAEELSQDAEAREAIQKSHDMLESREIPITALARAMHKDTRTVHKNYEQVGYPLHIGKGRMPTLNRDEIAEQIAQFHATTGLSPGYKRLAESISPGHPPYHAVYDLMFPQGPESHHGKPSHLKRYHAKYTNYLWHTDLHELYSERGEGGSRLVIYMIAFMDDATRAITGWDIISDKHATTTARVLESVLQSQPRPCILGTDNGGEFRATIFVNVLTRYGVKTWYGDPYTPQHNGKIERFWQTLDRTTKHSHDTDVIASFIHWYNHSFVHSSLEMTPMAACERIPRWDQLPPGQLQPDIWDNIVWEA